MAEYGRMDLLDGVCGGEGRRLFFSSARGKAWLDLWWCVTEKRFGRFASGREREQKVDRGVEGCSCGERGTERGKTYVHRAKGSAGVEGREKRKPC